MNWDCVAPRSTFTRCIFRFMGAGPKSINIYPSRYLNRGYESTGVFKVCISKTYMVVPIKGPVRPCRAKKYLCLSSTLIYRYCITGYESRAEIRADVIPVLRTPGPAGWYRYVRPYRYRVVDQYWHSNNSARCRLHVPRYCSIRILVLLDYCSTTRRL